MFGVLHDFGRPMRASRRLGRASKLRRQGSDQAAAENYEEVLGILDGLHRLPPTHGSFSMRDGAHFSIRIVATMNLAVLSARLGNEVAAQRRAREGLGLCNHARAIGHDAEHIRKWTQWAKDYLAWAERDRDR